MFTLISFAVLKWDKCLSVQLPFELLVHILVQLLLELEANWIDQSVNEPEFELSRMWIKQPYDDCLITTWRLLDNCIWQLTIADNCWQPLTIADNHWKLRTKADDHWWQLTIADDCWQLLTTADNRWQLLTTTVNRWQPLSTADNHWQLLTTAENRWQPLTTADNRWQPLTVRLLTTTTTDSAFADKCSWLLACSYFIDYTLLAK